MSAADAVREVARAALVDRGLDVIDVTVTPAGRRRVVRILVDRSVAGLDPNDHTSRVPPMDLDEVTEATHTVSAALDSTEPLGDAPYVLEVSSPGVDRPLRTWAQLRRNVGRLVTVTTSGSQQLGGRIVAVGPDALTLARPEGPELVVPVAEVVLVRVEVEFSHGPDAPDDPDGLDDDTEYVDEDE
ncbi:MAG: ribosome maturation factor RimP [Dermatophilaceae bacterium]